MGVKRARTLVSQGPTEQLTSVVSRWRSFVSGDVQVDQTLENVIKELNKLSGLSNDNARNRWRRYFVKQKTTMDGGDYHDPDLPERVPEMTRELCFAHHTLIVILSYKLSQIDSSKIGRGHIFMPHAWQVTVYVILTALGRVQLNELDPTSEADLDTMDDFYRHYVSTAAELCCLTDDNYRVVVEHVMDIIHDFVKLQTNFIHNLATVTALNLGTNTSIADIASWETVDVTTSPARGLVLCDICGSYFSATDMVAVTAKTFNGAVRVFNAHKELIVFIQVAHIHLTMGKTIALNPGHVNVSIDEWVKTVSSTYSVCLSKFHALLLATITRLSIEENFELIDVP